MKHEYFFFNFQVWHVQKSAYIIIKQLNEFSKTENIYALSSQIKK